MARSWHHLVDLQVGRRGVLARRDFLRVMGLTGAAAAATSWTDRLTACADELRQRDMSCILLWMQGGPSQFETFSPKPGHPNGGETQAISTNVPGIQIAETLPNVAQVMDKLCLIRSMTSREGSHPRASFLMHTGYLPTASVKYPTLGSHVVQQLADTEFDLPSFVRIGRVQNGSDAGFLGVEFDPFVMTSAERPPDNTAITTSPQRYRRRLGLLDRLESHYKSAGGEVEVDHHRKLYRQASRMVLSSKMEAFDVEREPERVRSEFGESPFATGCLLARRLIEAGVTFVEVAAGNWDTHFDNADRTRELCGQVDQPFAALLRDLEDRGRLERTLVVWMGEFGRTPRINARAGRDHYPRAFNVALAGGNIAGGQVIGATDTGGTSVTDRPVEVSDLLRTICHGLGVDADQENYSGVGRPIRVVDGGDVVHEAFRVV